MLSKNELSQLLKRYEQDAMATALTTERNKDLLIRACGLAGEFGEYVSSTYNRDEEGADVFWYGASIAKVLGFSLGGSEFLDQFFAHRAEGRSSEATTRGFLAVARVCEFAKKVGGHGRDKPIGPVIADVAYVLAMVSRYWNGPELSAALAANIAKLRARHANAGPGGFDPNYGKPAFIRVECPACGPDHVPESCDYLRRQRAEAEEQARASGGDGAA